jgi:REP element-mobilizing transposase RayT
MFVTWRMKGSLPRHRHFPGHTLTSGQAFVAMDRLLDCASGGPRHLSRPEIARLVVNAIHHHELPLAHYTLHAYVIMPNHVHLLITPRTAIPKLLQSLKGFTATQANRILGSTGQAFWQEESYDHWVRDGKELARIMAYIEDNPVRAGLVATPEAYPWSRRLRRAAPHLAVRAG